MFLQLISWFNPVSVVSATIVAVVAGIFTVGCTLKLGPFADQSDLDQWSNRLAESSRLYVPTTEGPHPILIYMHGCVRFVEHADLWGQALASQGYAMLMIDSFGPRNIGERAQRSAVCTGFRLQGRERSGDLWAALNMIKKNIGLDGANIDSSRIAAIGFSHGAWSIMDMMTQWTTGKLPGSLTSTQVPPPVPTVQDLKALVLFYPWCRAFSLTQTVGAWSTIPPTHFVRPYNDTVVGTDGCNKNIADLSTAALASGQGPVSNLIIDASDHAFDEPSGDHIPFEPVPTQQAIDSVISFLDQSL